MTRDEVVAECAPLSSSKIVPIGGRKKIRIPTINIVDDFFALGWEPVATFTKRSTSKNAKHAIVFDIPNLSFGVKSAKDLVTPQVILTGDNGLTPFRVYVSFLRAQCGTRLLVPVRDSKKLTAKSFYISFNSKGYSPALLRSTLRAVLQSVLLNSKKTFEFIETPLTEEQMNRFAASAYLRRQNVQPSLIGKRIESVSDLTVGLLLAAFREQDKSDNVWHVLSRVHEKVIRGFKTYPSRKSKRLFQYRSLQNFEKVIRISIQLYLDIFKIVSE